MKMKAATGSLRRIRHASDPLDLSWVGQLHRPDGPPDGTREEDLSAAARCHPPLHHLREQQQRACPLRAAVTGLYDNV